MKHAWRVTTLVAGITLFAVSLAGAQQGRRTTIDGTWSGDIFVSSAFRPPFFVVNAGGGPGGDSPTSVVQFTFVTNNSCGAVPCTIGISNRSFRLGLPSDAVLVKSERASVTLDLRSSGPGLTGALTSPDGTTGTVDGVAVSQNFFLFHVTVNDVEPGACAPGRFQGSGSVLPSSPNTLVLSLSGTDSHCNHQGVTATLTR